MQCPSCGVTNTEVIDSRLSTNNHKTEYKTTRRRRKCCKCGERFTTYEMTSDSLIKLITTLSNQNEIIKDLKKKKPKENIPDPKKEEIKENGEIKIKEKIAPKKPDVYKQLKHMYENHLIMEDMPN